MIEYIQLTPRYASMLNTTASCSASILDLGRYSTLIVLLRSESAAEVRVAKAFDCELLPLGNFSIYAELKPLNNFGHF